MSTHRTGGKEKSGHSRVARDGGDRLPRFSTGICFYFSTRRTADEGNSSCSRCNGVPVETAAATMGILIRDNDVIKV